MDCAASEPLKAALRAAAALPALSDDDRALLRPLAERDEPGVPVAALRALARAHAACPERVPALAGLVRGAGLHFPLAEKRAEPSAEAAERRRLLLLRAEERKYQQLTGNVKGLEQARGIGEEKNVFLQASHGINMLVGAIAGYVSFYAFGRGSFEEEAHAQACGIAGATLVLMVEMGLYVIRSSKSIAVAERRRVAAEDVGLAGAGAAAGARRAGRRQQ